MTAPTPIRSDDEVVGAIVPITLAGKEYVLAELPRKANREFQKLLTSRVRERIDAVGPLETADEVMDAIAEAADLWFDLLLSYDELGANAWAEVRGTEPKPVLTDREWLDAHATDGECYRAIKKVTAAVYPFGFDLLALVPEIMPAMLRAVSKGVAAATLVISSRSTSSALPNTAGSPTTSSVVSPTPS